MAVINSGLGGTAGYGEGTFSTTPKAAGSNDDGSVEVDISSVFGAAGMNFFGTNHTSLYINSNGVINFGAADTSYAGNDLSALSQPSIAAFWTDHNIDNGGEIYWDLDPSAGTVTITWHDVAPYSGSGTNTYQVVLQDAGNGDVNIEFIYENIGWPQSGGSSAITGITNGDDEHHPLEGSGNPDDLKWYDGEDEDGNNHDDFDGTFEIKLIDGRPQSQDGSVDGTDNDDTLILSGLDLDGDAITTGADSVLAGAGDDYVDGDDGADTIHGGEGSDTILGGEGNDQIFGDGSSPEPETTTTTITASNYSATDQGFRVTARNVENGTLTSASTSNISAAMGGFGAGGAVSDSDSGIFEQTGFDLASGLSEQLIVEFDEAVSEASFSFQSLFTAGFGEQAQWAIYDNGTLVAQSTFTEQGQDSGNGTIDLSGYGSFDQIIFTGLQQTDGSDGSDFFITEVTFEAITTGTANDDSLIGGDGFDEIYGGLGGDTITGDAGDDTIFGEDGDDSIAGGIGDDSVLGGAGADTISGGDGNDYIDGGDGDDLLTTGIGNDTLVGGQGNDTLMNSSGDDSLVGGSGDDVIIATEGNDTLEGGTGNDTLEGGADNDSLDGGDGDDSLSGDEGDDELLGGEGLDTLAGGTGNDTLLGGGGADTLAGGDGDDLLYGGDGNDVLTTGLGNDTLYGEDGDDTLSNSAGDDSLDGGAGNDSITATAGEDTLRGGTGDDTMSGGDDADTFIIEDGFGNDVITGGEGTTDSGEQDFDVIDLSALSGPVTVTYDSDGAESGTITDGTDTITFSEIEQIILTDQADSVDGSASHDGFFGDAPGINVEGRGGDDTIIGGRGGDTIDGGTGDDSIEGGYGDDSIAGGAGNDTLYGGDPGNLSGPGNDTIEGGEGSDFIDGGDESDMLSGGADNDTVLGGRGEDTLMGGGGNDSLDGGDDEDTFVLQDGFGNDTIIGGEGGNDDDTIDLSALSGPVTVTYTSDESGTITDGTDTITFSEVERIITTDHADVVDASSQTGTTGINVETRGGDDTITGGDNADTIDGGAGADSINAGDGDDFVTYAVGGDTVDGGAGNDLIRGGFDQGTDDAVLRGGEGDDTIATYGANDTVSGDAGNDFINADSGDESIDGGADDDTILANSGNDTITGGTGDDSISGGAGDDIFNYSVGDGQDTITDFNTGNSGALGDGDVENNDYIDLSGFYDNLTELREDFNDDGVLNQSNSTADGGTVDYSDNDEFQSTDGLTFQGADQSSFRSDNTGVVCFTSGTAIRTPRGEVLVENLRVGELVTTLDNGAQRICWIGKTTLGPEGLRANPKARPILIKRGILGVTRDLLVSPQHCMLTDPDTLMRATHLAQTHAGIRIAQGKRHVSYFHVMFETHQIIFAEGAPSESFYPGPMAIKMMGSSARKTLAGIMPWVSNHITRAEVIDLYGPPARRISKKGGVAPRKLILA